ncbi:EmrB/QacA subfamily drug resistance transporter [Allobranchiibius huperziae]|uniref:EmrB/QacA subfamily drug resistance transporter n=2 Tax=Allobranchiibius huperziae TaxID=1874116 RepID=A0A853DJ95_9MICO|nr:EmrB/QacA subfamily drug resistance transporter [Allobranchiibius huperziae]
MEMTRRRRMLVLGICCMSLFVVGIDVTAVNLALPSISTDLHASFSQLQWVLDAYTLVLASLLMLSGSVADRIGRRKVFQVGLVLFGGGSLLCSLSVSAPMLIGARGLQAVGGSMLNPVAMSIITNTFTEARERAQAIGVWGGTVGLSMALGPVVGGGLVDAVGWKAIFWINVPIVAAAAVLAARYVPESRAATARRLDPVGQLLVIGLLASLTYGIIEGRGLGWTSGRVLLCAAVAVGCAVAIGVVEPRRAQPLIELGFFRSVPFTGAVVCAVVGFASLGGFLFVNTLYLQQARGMSPVHAGLMTLPMAGMIALCAPVSGRLVGRIGPRVSMIVAGVGFTTSALILTTLRTDTSLVELGVAYVGFGIGFGFLNAPITNAAVSGMPREQSGVAAAIASTSRQVGSALGVAVFGALASARLTGPLRISLATASHAGWWVMAGCGVALFAMAFVTTSERARRSAYEPAAA